jgi:hypothetical protein
LHQTKKKKNNRKILLNKRKYYFDRFFCEGPLILCFGLMGRPFGQDCVFPLNLAYVPFGHDEFLT